MFGFEADELGAGCGGKLVFPRRKLVDRTARPLPSTEVKVEVREVQKRLGDCGATAGTLAHVDGRLQMN
jgi:hypothetical protein